MNEINYQKNLTVRALLLTVNLINLLDIQVRTLFLILFTTLFSIGLWRVKDMDLDQFMKWTRRPPVLSLTDTVPFNVIKANSTAIEETLPPKIVATEPPKMVLKVKTPAVLAKSVIVYDNNSGKVLFSKNPDLKLPPASLVKLLSIMVFSQDLSLDLTTKVPAECTSINGQKLGFKSGEAVNVKDLIYSSLIYSAADSVCTLSKINPSLDLAYFNNYAKKIGMLNSNFTNYIGLDFEDNDTTANDVLTMTREFIKKDLFNNIVKLKSYQLQNGKVVYNTNKMLFENQYSIGIKTGTTGEANENLIYRYKNDNLNEDVIVIIMNSSDRYQDTRNIIYNLYLAAE